MNVVDKAAKFALEAHGEQLRKYTGERYIVHPAAVVEIVKTVDHDSAMLAAAWLHDVVEDTPVDAGEILREFGPRIAYLVHCLTDISKPGDGNRQVRKAIDRAHIARACSDAQTIKLADLIDNTTSIVGHDPNFARVYLREKKLLLAVLVKGDPVLHAAAEAQVKMHMDGWEGGRDGEKSR